ncbi:MAG TPA: SRPBCC domain-containing protein [Thermoanaerobaculia bacterium]|nr:SRPBCC domain-containing protein [Thermoanaerobaculia bacterium]
MEIASAHYATVLVETRIAADPETVWRALTAEMGEWWPDAFYTGGKPEGRTLRFDARPGGSMVEDWGEGQGLMWGQVATVDRPRKLEVVGYAFPQWGGPSTWLGTWDLEADGDGTVVRFSEAAVGRITESYGAEKEKGWRFLFDGALKAYVEGTEPPVWKD